MNFSNFKFNFGNGGRGYTRNQYEEKSLIWQSYKDCGQNLWKQISLEELKKDVEAEPKFYNKRIYFIAQDEDGYKIYNEFARLIFYNHYEKRFMYLTSQKQLIMESVLYESEEEALKGLQNEMKKVEGTTYLNGIRIN